MLARTNLLDLIEPRSLLRGSVRSIARLLDADRRYRDAEHLANLDDRMLRDIGITRSEAETEARRLKSSAPAAFLERQGY